MWGRALLAQDYGQWTLPGLSKRILAPTPSRQRKMEPQMGTELLIVGDEEKERSFPKGVDLLWKASVPQTPGLTLREQPAAACGPRWQTAPQLITQPAP